MGKLGSLEKVVDMRHQMSIYLFEQKFKSEMGITVW